MRNRIALVVSAILVVGLVVGLTTSASAGSGGSGDTGAKKKKKKTCKAGTHKVTVKKKNGKKKKKCVPDATAPTPAQPTTLSISPASADFGNAEHGGFDVCQPDPDPDCPTRAFTVTNSGGAPSGVPAASITEVLNPGGIGVEPPAFRVTANSCTAALPPGGSCSVTVKFAPQNNPGDEHFRSVLHVVASPGSDAQSTLDGMAL
jgi:hypothetical protein